MRDNLFMFPLLVLAAATALAQPPTIPVATDVEPAGVPGRPVLVFLPQQFFSDEEFDGTLKHLSRAGVTVKIAATETTAALSMDRVMVNPDVPLAAAGAADYTGIILVGGSGASLYWDDSLVQARCREFAAAGRVVAAIGIAPVTLARAGLLKGRRATVFRDRDAIGFLKAGGARYRFRDLEADRGVVTAAGSDQARAFGRAVAAAILRDR